MRLVARARRFYSTGQACPTENGNKRTLLKSTQGVEIEGKIEKKQTIDRGLT